MAIRLAAAKWPPLLLIAARCLAGAAVLAPWALRPALGRPTAREWGAAALSGGLLFVVGHGLLAWSEQAASSGQAALCYATLPLWSVLLDALACRRVPPTPTLLGLGLGVAGVAVLVGGPGSALGGPAALALLVSTFGWTGDWGGPASDGGAGPHRSAPGLRRALGGTPTKRLKARLKAASES